MTRGARISSEERRAAILRSAGEVFIEKGFHRTTTRDLAKAAGVSEALLFKHFPSKEALYSAIQMSFLDKEGPKRMELLQTLEPSTRTLVFLVQDLVSHVVGGDPGERGQGFLRLVLRSLMDEGQFARVAIRTGPFRWVQKVDECIAAARASGDIGDDAAPGNLGGWLAHQLIAGIVMHSLPSDPVVDYGVPREELAQHVVRFCLRGIGLKETAIQKWCMSRSN